MSKPDIPYFTPRLRGMQPPPKLNLLSGAVDESSVRPWKTAQVSSMSIAHTNSRTSSKQLNSIENRDGLGHSQEDTQRQR